MSEKNTILIEFVNETDNKVHDIEIPIDITANELIIALNEAYSLGIDTLNIRNCYMCCENPVALLKGTKTLEKFGMRTGTKVIYRRR